MNMFVAPKYTVNSAGLLPYTGKVLTDCPVSWAFGVSDFVWRKKVDHYLDALWTLTLAGLNAAAVGTQFHQRRVIPLMERTLPIFEMLEGADPKVLEHSWLVAEPFPPAYAAQRARRAVDTKKVMCNPDEVLWSPRCAPRTGTLSW
jgi:hypothetical protein